MTSDALSLDSTDEERSRTASDWGGESVSAPEGPVAGRSGERPEEDEDEDADELLLQASPGEQGSETEARAAVDRVRSASVDMPGLTKAAVFILSLN